MSNILVIGGEGQVGRELVNISGDIVYSSHRKELPEYLPIEDQDAVLRYTSECSPDVIINVAAATNVDRCEAEHAMAYNTNGIGVRNIVNAARRLNAKLIHISTDYIFDGIKGNYSESDYPNPINYYGFSKLVGEIFAQSYHDSLIVRTSGVFGNMRNFPYYVVHNLKKREKMNIIEGYYSPIHARNLAWTILKLSHTNVKGILNIAGERISRMGFARQVANIFDLDESLLVEVRKFESMRAKRPYDTSLDLTKSKRLLDFDFYSVESNTKHFLKSYNKIV